MKRKTPHLGNERGTALVAVLILGLLLASASVAAWLLSSAQLKAAQRRLERARVERAALAAVSVATRWFEDPERPGLVSPPSDSELDRDQRIIDPDGDGRGQLWSAAPAPWNLRHRDAGGPSSFRPPDRSSAGTAADLFVGTASGPDLQLRADAPTLRALSSLIGPDARTQVQQVRVFGPPPRTGERLLATVEVEVSAPLPGSPPIRVRARAEVLALDWGRIDRPIETRSAATFQGAAGWRWGEALIGGPLTASAATRAGWPGGAPWLAPDRVLRADADGDGTADDADGDGVADLASWLADPAPVEDPWWRLRAAGPLQPGALPGGPCHQPHLFGPRRTPPEPADKRDERSGIIVDCPSRRGAEVPAPAWSILERSGAAGLRRYSEIPGRPGQFRLEGRGPAQPLADVIPRSGEAVILDLDPAISAPLSLPLASGRGAVLLRGRDVSSLGRSVARVTPVIEPAIRDTRGDERAAWTIDDCLPLIPDLGACSGFATGYWQPAADCRTLVPVRCPGIDAHFEGLISATHSMVLEGPVTILGTVRARSLFADGQVGAVEVRAHAAHAMRPGPPGSPRVLPLRRRIVR